MLQLAALEHLESESAAVVLATRSAIVAMAPNTVIFVASKPDNQSLEQNEHIAA